MKQNKIYIYGRHALREALTNAPRALRRVYFAREMHDQKLRQLAKQTGVIVEELDSRKASSWVEGGAPHQGAIALVSLAELVVPYDQWVNNPLHNVGKQKQSLVLLNEVQDPHNVGAVIRSAAAFGASAVLLPGSKQSPVTGAVIKASAGMAFTLPLISIDNIQQTVADLKKRGFRVYGLAGEGKNTLDAEEFTAPALFILGNESKGLPQKTAQICDRVLSISIEPKAESLNVAAAAAITLYAWHTKRQ
ncbi:MAG: 23S rRNA (guanosine(2251)-2'-O)-methyltransferase RlmB [Candidatus Adlerbacteria bacterium]|nr:23S rRNA (guanosine(2251)-2'-O)-methyltransferase RlmB [Candidatus Adlerbacteria bacterium]